MKLYIKDITTEFVTVPTSDYIVDFAEILENIKFSEKVNWVHRYYLDEKYQNDSNCKGLLNYSYAKIANYKLQLIINNDIRTEIGIEEPEYKFLRLNADKAQYITLVSDVACQPIIEITQVNEELVPPKPVWYHCGFCQKDDCLTKVYYDKPLCEIKKK